MLLYTTDDALYGNTVKERYLRDTRSTVWFCALPIKAYRYFMPYVTVELRAEVLLWVCFVRQLSKNRLRFFSHLIILALSSICIAVLQKKR